VVASLGANISPVLAFIKVVLSVLGDNAFILSLLIVYSDFGNLREV
jgi:hypothetical protein